MNIKYTELCFLRSSRPGQINTDGVISTIRPSAVNGSVDPAGILILPVSTATRIRKQVGSEHVAIHRSLNIMAGDSDKIDPPEIFDGTQDLCGKKVVIIMVNGWGDTILVQPAIRALFESVAQTGPQPEITLACGWIKNFAYLNTSYIFNVRPNIFSLKDLCYFDVMINLTQLNHERVKNKSMKDHYLEAFGLAHLKDRLPRPSIKANPARIEKLMLPLNEIRMQTGKKLLYINWKSRQIHKNASAELTKTISEKLSDRCHAVFFKDKAAADEMEQEAKACNAPVENLSHLICDLHDTIAAITLVDAVISVDTGIVHAAGALGVPGMALFGPFPPETHIADYPGIKAVTAGFQGNICKVPCEETHKGCAEIDFSNHRISPCFAALDPDKIVNTFSRKFKL